MMRKLPEKQYVYKERLLIKHCKQEIRQNMSAFKANASGRVAYYTYLLGLYSHC
jgi:hypothetical protein